jgi:hypothetical protein
MTAVQETRGQILDRDHIQNQLPGLLCGGCPIQTWIQKLGWYRLGFSIAVNLAIFQNTFHSPTLLGCCAASYSHRKYNRTLVWAHSQLFWTPGDYLTGFSEA